MRARIALKDGGARFFKSDAVGRVSAVTTGVEICDNRGRFPPTEDVYPEERMPWASLIQH